MRNHAIQAFKRSRCAILAAAAIGCLSSVSHAQVTQYNDATAWKAAVPGYEARAFDEFYPGISGGAGCLTGPPGPGIALTGETMTARGFLSNGVEDCAIRDSSTPPQVSDGHASDGGTFELSFEPSVSAFFTYFGSLDVGDVVNITLYDASGAVIAAFAGDASTHTVNSLGYGFTSTVPVARIRFDPTETGGGTLVGVWVRLVAGEPSLGTVTIGGYDGPDEGDGPETIQLDFGVFFDCNMNGVSDDQDISGATSADIDGDGIPDECEPIVNVTQGILAASIQVAIDEAISGDVIEVPAGTYNHVFDFKGKDITVRSTDPLNPAVVAATIIDGSGFNDSVVKCISGEGPGTILEGLTIIGGSGDPAVFSRSGGGVIINNASSPIVRHCVFDSNTGRNGGALFAGTGCAPTVTDCTFSNNGDQYGGAVYNYFTAPTQYTNCIFDTNTVTQQGGAIYNNNSPVTLNSCDFDNNTSPSYGAIANRNSSTLDIDDCTFTSNQSTGNAGGAIYNDGGLNSVTNCIFDSNTASGTGGAIYSSGAATVYTDCQFVGNSSTSSWGGAIYHFNAQSPGISLTGCVFDGNTAGFNGGAIGLDFNSNADITNCTFTNCDASNYGGAVYCDGDSGLNTFTGCTFESNTAKRGGGIYNLAVLQMTNCILVGNTASDYGGGVFTSNGSALNSTVNCVFSTNEAMANEGGAIYHVSGGTITNCSFTMNTAGTLGDAVRHYSYPASMTNCVLWNNGADEVSIGSSTLTVTHCNVMGGYAGAGNLDADPLFADADGADNIVGTIDDDLRLLMGSPCTDAGDDTAVPVGIITDLDGNPRFVDGDYDTLAQVDMGAYELNPEVVGQIVNLTKDIVYSSFGSAFAAADDGDQLLASSQAFANDGNVNFSGKKVTLVSTGDISHPGGGQYLLTDDAVLDASAGGTGLTLNTLLRVQSGETADIITSGMNVSGTGELSVRPNAGLFVTNSAAATLDGQTTLLGGATLSFTGDATNGGDFDAISGATIDVGGAFASTGDTSLIGGVALLADTVSNSGTAQWSGINVLANALINSVGGSAVLSGELFTPVTNDASMTYIGSSTVVGDYTNNDTTIVQIGTLTIIGSLINNGTIIGDVQTSPLSGGGGGTQPGDGMSIQGDFIAGPSASLSMPDPVWRLTVSGDYDVAVNDNTLYHMVDAELRLSGGSSPQNLEIMSVDIGADSAGFDRTLPGHYPIGTLRIGPALTTVDMVDAHDNDGFGQGVCEAIYAKTLIVESGGTLNTNGCIVYYETLQLDGIVDEPLNLVQVAPCPADTNGDTMVNVTDLLTLLAAWGSNPGHPADINDDGAVNVTDLLALLAAWGPC